jgi:hypothetical protein
MSGCECKRDSAQPVIKGIGPMQVGPIPLFLYLGRSGRPKPIPLEIQKICRNFKKSAGKKFFQQK